MRSVQERQSLGFKKSTCGERDATVAQVGSADGEDTQPTENPAHISTVAGQ